MHLRCTRSESGLDRFTSKDNTQHPQTSYSIISIVKPNTHNSVTVDLRCTRSEFGLDRSTSKGNTQHPQTSYSIISIVKPNTHNSVTVQLRCTRSEFGLDRSTSKDNTQHPQTSYSNISIVKPTRCTNVLNSFSFGIHSTCFGRSFRPSSRVQDCTYSNTHSSNRYCCLLASRYEIELQFHIVPGKTFRNI